MARDAWLRELEDAMGMAEEIEARVAELASSSSPSPPAADPSRLISAARHKVAALATSLDRLESLLHNPPVKPHLIETELCRRWDMLLGIRFKLKQMAASLNAESQKRIDLCQNSRKNIPDAETASNIVHKNLIHLQNQKIGEEDENLGTMAVNAKHISLALDDKLDLQSCLLGDLNDGADLSETQLKEGSSRHRFGLFCLLILGFLTLMLIVWTVIKIV